MTNDEDHAAIQAMLDKLRCEMDRHFRWTPRVDHWIVLIVVLLVMILIRVW